MGGAASTRKKGKKGKAEEAGGLDLPPTVLRRRRVLFGTAAGPQPFERVGPLEQFTEFPEALVEDLVFERIGLPAANKFRHQAQKVCNVDGYLGPHAIDLLELDIGTRAAKQSALSDRLFKIGQVGRLLPFQDMGEPDSMPKEKEPPQARREFLTCYELLALFSVLRAGTKDEMLELLFCVFDVDEDDKVSLEDFEATVVSYLEMEGSLEGGLHGLAGADLDEYKKVEGKERTQAARRVAELAVAQYGSAGMHAALEPSHPEHDDAHHEGLEKKHEKDTGASSGAEDKKKAKKKGGWCCLCKGKQPASPKHESKESKDEKKKPLLGEEDSDEDSGAFSSDEERKNKKKQKEDAKEGEAAPKRKGRFSCFSPRRGTPKKDDKTKDKDKGKDSENEGLIKSSNAAEGGPKLIKDGPEPKEEKKSEKPPTPKAKDAPKRQKVGCCPMCRGKPKRPNARQPPPPLTFEQWRNWFNENFGDCLGPDLQARPGGGGTMPAPISTMPYNPGYPAAGGGDDMTAIRTLPPSNMAARGTPDVNRSLQPATGGRGHHMHGDDDDSMGDSIDMHRGIS